MNLRWFVSARIRHATAMRKHVQKILNHQRDILSPPAVEAVNIALSEIRKSIAQNDKPELLEKQMGNLETGRQQMVKAVPKCCLAGKYRGFACGTRCGNGHPNFLPAAL